MEVKLMRGTNNNQKVVTGINPKELTKETYEHYCRLYLIQKIYDALDTAEYKVVANIINSIDAVLFNNLQLETNKLLLLNEIHSLIMANMDVNLSREFLYDKMVHLANYDPALYQ